MRKIITYAIHPDVGIVSRVGSEVAWPVIDYEKAVPENNFRLDTHLERFDVSSVIRSEWDFLKWTKKVNIEQKNEHRKFWGMKPLSGN